jgi:hypothetical protein
VKAKEKEKELEEVEGRVAGRRLFMSSRSVAKLWVAQ